MYIIHFDDNYNLVYSDTMINYNYICSLLSRYFEFTYPTTAFCSSSLMVLMLQQPPKYRRMQAAALTTMASFLALSSILSATLAFLAYLFKVTSINMADLICFKNKKATQEQCSRDITEKNKMLVLLFGFVSKIWLQRRH